MTTQKLQGVFAPVVTPFTPDFNTDYTLFAKHCRWLLEQGAGLAPFGTNSEANSLSLKERMQLLGALLADGFDPKRMLPGTGCCALPDTVTLTREATTAGCAGVLVLPPFFYKNLSDDGLFRYYAEVIERVGLDSLRLYLYHIPALSGVPITLNLIERLLRAYPAQLAGIKDSSGDWNNIKAMLDAFPEIAVFPASESFISRAMPLGAAGCISATLNVNPRAISELYLNWQGPDAEAQQKAVDAVRATFQRFPMIAALKHAIAHYGDRPHWQVQRPPLVPLDGTQSAELLSALGGIGFSMPGIQ